MPYQISRNGQTYGPYTLENLQQYLASGNVLPTDMAKSEEMSDWAPVSQILNQQAAPDAPPVGFNTPSYADPGIASADYSNPGYPNPGGDGGYMPGGQAQALSASTYPDAPNLHWGLVLLFSFLTCGLFMPIWNLVVSAWLRRVQPNSTALLLYIGVVVLWFLDFIVAGASRAHIVMTQGYGRFGPHLIVRALLIGVIWIVRLIARYSERASLEEHFNTAEPVGLQLNPVMTFFFGGLYFQANLNRINAMKQAVRFGMGGRGY